MHLIWEEFLKIIKEEAGSQIVETWFKAVSLQHWDTTTSTVTLNTPNQFVSRWIQEHYANLLKTHLARLLHAPVLKISFVNDKTSPEASQKSSFIPASMIQETENTHMQPTTQENKNFEAPSHFTKSTSIIPAKQDAFAAPEKKGRERTGSQLNGQYSFDNFIVGANNSLAHAAAWAICENLGKVYNPMFIYGGTGMGKTHLMHAIGNEVQRRSSSLVVRYETADNFINDFINSIRFDRSQQFRARYHKVDLFLFDDIQFLSNKEQTQESFFHVFNTLYEQKKQIVFSSDTFPKEITGLQNRLKSRMEWGLVADIQSPTLETKIAILQKKADLHKLSLPNDVADFIASRVMSNIRELEGALVRVGAFASLTGQPITLELAQKVLFTLQQPSKKEGVTLELVMRIIAKHYNINVNDIKSKKRNQEISTVRQLTFYLMKKLSFCSLQIIGNHVGGRDHSTVIHSIGKIEQMLKTDPLLAQKINALEQEILNS